MESEKRKKVSEELSDEVGDFESCLRKNRDFEEQLTNFVAHGGTKISDSNQENISEKW